MNYIVLFNPEIPQNSGNIIRTCMASSFKLIMIKPLGFDISDASFKRAGLDYLRSFTFDVCENFDDFKNKYHPDNVFLITRFGDKTYTNINVSDTSKDYFFIFGSETKGLPDYIHQAYSSTRLRVPMQENARCLNLSNTVAIIAYEALRQQKFEGLSLENKLEG